MTTIELPVEVQLLRDWKPRGRATRGYIRLDYSTTGIVLSTAGENIRVEITGAARVSPAWCLFRTRFHIDGIPFGDFRPGVLWIGASDIPSAVVHFGEMAGRDNERFSGWHSLLFRAVERAD